jgi:hypothetical protein
LNRGRYRSQKLPTLRGVLFDGGEPAILEPVVFLNGRDAEGNVDNPGKGNQDGKKAMTATGRQKEFPKGLGKRLRITHISLVNMATAPESSVDVPVAVPVCEN